MRVSLLGARRGDGVWLRVKGPILAEKDDFFNSGFRLTMNSHLCFGIDFDQFYFCTGELGGFYAV